jgi:hypothetical protein
VNVPVTVDTMVSLLLRAHEQTHIIRIKLMRRINYKTAYISEKIRPPVMREWAQHLIQQQPYFKHGISLTPDYLH